MPKTIFRICLLPLLATVLPAQTVYLRSANTGFCFVSGATNTTPIRLTVLGSCGLFNGATIVVVDVRGNTAANIHLESAGDTANVARKVANLTGNSFDLLDLNDNPVNGTIHASCSGSPTTHMGTCAYTGGGRLGLATASTMRPHPIGYFDGPSGPRTTAMFDPLNKANTANPSYTVVRNNAADYIANYGGRWGYELARAQFRGHPTMDSALTWKLDGNVAARDAALFGMRNPDQLMGSSACDEADKDCRLPLNSLAAFPFYGSISYLQAYTLMRDEMTPAERSAFFEYFLSDLPWSQAGVNYTGTSLIKPQLRATTGTVTATSFGTTVTGAGTAFTTQTTVGDFIIFPADSYGKPYMVQSIESDTSLTVTAPIFSFTGVGSLTNATWLSAPRWNPSMYGFVWNQKHFVFTPLNGGGEPPPGSPYAVASPYLGDLSGFYQIGDHNHSIDRAVAMYLIGLTACADDPRGCLLASMAHEWMNDRALPYALQIWTGFSQVNPIYHQQNTTGRVLTWAAWTKNSFVGEPDPLAGTNIRQELADWMSYGTIPKLAAHVPNAENYLVSPNVDRMASALMAMADDKTAAHSRHLYWWLNNVPWYNNGTQTYGTGAVGYATGGWAWEHYVLYEPTTIPLPPTETSHLFTDANGARCTATFGTNCPPAEDVRRFGISRTDWSESSTYVAFNATGFGCRDHCGDDLGGYFFIFKEGRPMLAGDTGSYMGSIQQRGYVEVGGTGNYYFAEPAIGTPTPWLAGTNEYLFMRTDLTKTYNAAAEVNSLDRQIIHLKQGAHDYVIDHVAGTFASAQSVKGLQHYNLDDCGTPSATTCASINRAGATANHTQSNARLNSRVFAVNSPVRIDTESGSETNGSYAAGSGGSFRWHVCPTTNGSSCAAATDIEWFVVHQPSSDPGATLPPMVSSTSGIFRTIEIQDPVSPKFAAFTSLGATALNLSFTTTHSATGQYVITGLGSGAYDITRDGNLIATSVAVSASSHSLSFTSVAGTFAVNWRAPLTITTTALPNAVLGQSYTGTVEAVSAAGPPYSWDVSAGALCAGLTLVPSTDTTRVGVQGAAQALGTCTFTIRVQTAGMIESDTRQFSITVVPANSTPLVLVSQLLPVARLGDLYLSRLRSTGGTAPVSWSLSAGSLCAGLTLSSAGVVSGVATVESACTFTVRVTDLGNQFQERQFNLTVIPDRQTTLRIDSFEVSHTAAVMRFGYRGLPYDQACTVALREGGSGGTLLQTLDSLQGPGRRQVVATGLPALSLIHATATCGASSIAVAFSTGAVPPAAVPVLIRLTPPALPGGPPADVVIAHGDTVAMPDSLIVSCSATECSALVGATGPLLYWTARYRDATGVTLALSPVHVTAPR